jgi:serine/threonine protein kinase
MGEMKQRQRSISGPLAGSSPDDTLADELEALRPGSVPELGSVIADKYRVERLVARGGMGAVYAATHLVSGKRVALKWMLPTIGQIPGARERFIREACATARIDHPNIVDIYDVGDERGSVYLVMEYLHGETLSERLERERIPPQEAIALFIPALRGVAAAHSHGVIHRDLKPDNIILCCTTEGELLEPKVLDFGISKITGDDARNHSLTRSGAVLGTPYYMSPEQVRGARDVDQRADVYAFGVMLYEVFTGQRPFDAETYNQLILKIVTDTPEPIATLNPAIDLRLVQIVERAMARDPGVRYPSIQALAVALEPFAGGVRFRSSATPIERSLPSITLSPSVLEMPAPTPLPGMLAAPGSSPALEVPSKSTRKHTRTTLVSAVIALVLSAAGYWWLQLQGDKPLNAAKASDEHHVEPAPLQPSAAAPVPKSAAVPEIAVEQNPVETTTSAAAVPPPASAGAPAERAAKVRSSMHKAFGARLVRDKRANESTDTAPALKRPSGDWDERLSDSPTRNTNNGATPAGQIDAHDFR